MKKEMVAGIGVVMLMGTTVGVNSVQAQAAQQAAHTGVEVQPSSPGEKRLEFLNQYAYQFHQLNNLQTERLELKKQMVDKRDQLVDLIIAAKKIGNKTLLKQAKGVKRQLKILNVEMKNLSTEVHDEKNTLKEARKHPNGIESGQFNKLISTNKQLNEKMKEKVKELDRMIEILN